MKLLLFLQALRLSFHFSSIHFYIISHHPHKFIQCGSRCGILLLLHISDGHIIHTKVSLCLCIFQDTNSYQSVEKTTQLFDNLTLQKKSIFSSLIACILLLISILQYYYDTKFVIILLSAKFYSYIEIRIFDSNINFFIFCYI